MKRYESRYCTFAVPDDWVAEPPFAFREPGEEGNRLGVQILERCLAEMPSAADYAKAQKEILHALYEGFEFLREGPRPPEGAGEGYFFAFRFLDEDERPAQGTSIYFTCGPLVCQLMLTGPDGPDKERDRLFEAIGKTFTFRQAEFLAGATAGRLTSEMLRIPQEETAKAWPGNWRKFRRCCVSLPVPSGWEAMEEEGDAVLRRNSAEIRLHREIGKYNEVDIWFADRLKRLQTAGDQLLGSERGEIERGPYAAVLYEEKGVERTWKTAAIKRSFDLFMEDRQPLVWTLRVPESSFPELCQAFESLIAASRIIDPEEWETHLANSWLNYTLRGPWQPEGDGVYAKLSVPPMLLFTSQENSHLPLSSLRSSISDSLMKGAAPAAGYSKEESLGFWGSNEAYHFDMSGVSEDHEPLNIRSVWVQAQSTLYGVMVRGADKEEVKQLFVSIMGAISIPGVR